MNPYDRTQKILDSARKVFAQSGYHDASIDDIIGEAGVARGTFYRYFRHKHDIFEAILEKTFQDLEERIQVIELGNQPSPEEQLRRNLERVLGYFHDDRRLCRILLTAAVGLAEGLDQRLDAFYLQVAGLLRRSLDEGVRIGLVRAADTTILAYLILGSIKEILYRCVLQDPDCDVRQLAQAILDHHLRGLLA